MVKRLEKSAKGYRGEVGIYLKDLGSAREWSYQADRLFPSASLIKLPVMGAVFQRIAQGELALTTPVVLLPQHRRKGSGRLRRQSAGTLFALESVLERLIADSDNTAMQMLVDLVGMDYLKGAFMPWGLIHTNIGEAGLDLTSRPVREENYTTAREMGMLLEKIYRGRFLNREVSRRMLEILKKSSQRTRIAKRLPPDWELAHKTGLLRRACHDVGIIFSPQGDYVLCVLTGKNRSYRQAKEWIAGLAGKTFPYYQKEQEPTFLTASR